MNILKQLWELLVSAAETTHVGMQTLPDGKIQVTITLTVDKAALLK